MKTLLRLSLLFIAAAIARADLTIEQKLEGKILNGNLTMKIKGDQARVDLPSTNMTALIDFKTGEMTTLVHAQKMAMKMNLTAAKKLLESQKAGVDLAAADKPKATGQMEKIGDWNCEIYEAKIGAITGKMWVTKDVPNGKSIMEQMNRLNAVTSNGLGIDPSKFALDGLVVKSEMETPVGKMTTTMVKVSEDAVADAEFTLPTGYEEMKFPGLK